MVSRANTLIAGLLGATAHFLFYFVFKYAYHLPYENIWLRMIAAMLCISVMFMHRLPKSFHPYAPYYWHFTLIFSLPFVFTVNLLMNNFNELWLYWEIFMVFVLMMFVPNWIMFLIDLFLGIAAAIVFFLLASPPIHLHPTFNIQLYAIVIIFSIMAGYIFSFANWKSMKILEQQKTEEKFRALEALAGGIAHEMRNPLTQIRHNLEEITKELIARPCVDEQKSATENPDKTIIKRIKQAQLAVNRGLHVIDLTLSNFRKDELSIKDLTCLSATAMTRKAIDEYGYASEEEKKMITLEPGDDFIFLGEEDNYTLVLYNLMVNALDFLRSIPDGHLRIRLEKGDTINRVYVRDNGPGIQPEVLPRIFDSFFTSGKKGGNGLGLAFCKRVMSSFNGDITCNSELGKYTEFVLQFPVVDPELIKSHESKLYAEYGSFFTGKRLLIACQNTQNRSTLQNLLAPLKVEITVVLDGKAALDALAKNHFDLLLGEPGLPVFNLEALIEKLRTTEKELPVIACIAASQTGSNGSQTCDGVLFLPTSLQEFLGTLKLTLETSKSSLKNSLSGKTVLVVDDLDFNRKLIKTMLNKLNVRILEGANGLE
ncbi:MAG TPA: hybrid sensor histidine kinase/response regulator, partial [Chlorobaculum parvum]|nr:hybrid sensor histidine kinase/response regulator [Chlorobaculum parvum]